MFSPIELEIELFCRGIRIDRSCELGEDARRISRTRAGLGSGLELVIPGKRKDLWVNVPVLERFAGRSPFIRSHDPERREFEPRYRIRDQRDGSSYDVRLPPEQAW